MKLYTYFRSSAAFRVRIALNLKGLSADPAFVHLRRSEHRATDYLEVNPQGLVPTLLDGGARIGQSLAIIEYLEECHPQPPLLPADAEGRARVRQLSLIVACDIHPLNNLQVLNYLNRTLGLGEEQRNTWYRHWVDQGFQALEALLSQSNATGRFCHGDSPTMADACLVPQVYNARRFQVSLEPYPTIARINETCVALDAFAKAAPDVQADAE